MTDERPAAGRHPLILVAPVYDEEELIGSFVARVLALEGPGAPVGLVVVDDGSSDLTCERLRDAWRQAGSGVALRLVRLSRNFGHQNAVLAGLTVAVEWAESLGAELIGVIDADLQDRPEDLGALVDAVVNGADVAYAVRRSRGEGWLFQRLAGAFHGVMARAARVPIPRDAGTFSVMRPLVARAILAISDRSPYFPGLRAWVGYRQVAVHLDREARSVGSSRVGTLGLVRLAANALLGYSDVPLKVLGLLAAGILALSIVAAVTILALRVAGKVEVQGTALIIASIFFSLGVQSVYLMLIAYFLSRSASEASPRRPYLISSDERLP